MNNVLTAIFVSFNFFKENMYISDPSSIIQLYVIAIFLRILNIFDKKIKK